MASEGEGLPGLTWRQKDRLLWRTRAAREREHRREALLAWLASIPWQWFATFTFAPRATRKGTLVRPHLAWARGLLHAALNRLNRVLFGKRYAKRWQGLLVFVAWELHKDGKPHAHALVLGCPAHVTYQQLKEWFFKELGIARWHPIEPGTPAIAYVTKYCLKEDQDELWEILGPTESLPAGPLFPERVAQG
jgi:hypothetical protein